MADFTFERLVQMKLPELREVMAGGVAPRFSDLIGWEFRGWNVLAPIAKPFMAALGFQRFAKGFFSRDVAAGVDVDVDALPYLEGYNVKIRSGSYLEPWAGNPSDDAPVRHSYFRVTNIGGARPKPEKHPNALLIDYQRGDPKPPLFEGGPLCGEAGLFDFVVHPSPQHHDLLVGAAYYRLQPLIVAAGIFVGERWREPKFLPPARLCG